MQKRSARMKVSSPTAAMADVYESYEDPLSESLKTFQLIEWQVGAVFAIDGKILGLEGFGCHDTFNRFFEKLVKSYALDALDSRSISRKESLPPDKARRFIASAIKSKGERHPSIGLGENITFESRTVSGAALVESNRLLCISAFKKEKERQLYGRWIPDATHIGEIEGLFRVYKYNIKSKVAYAWRSTIQTMADPQTN